MDPLLPRGILFPANIDIAEGRAPGLIMDMFWSKTASSTT